MAVMLTDTEEIGASLFRAVEFAKQVEAPDWDGLSLEHQAPYLLLAKHGPALLESMEGRPWHEVAFALFHRVAPEGAEGVPVEALWAALPPACKLAWEACARHLAAICDQVEDVTLDELERSWAGWALERVKKLRLYTEG